MRKGQAIIRHGQLVMRAFPFSLLAGSVPNVVSRDALRGKKSGPPIRIVWNETLRQVRDWLCPWARLTIYGQRWSPDPPPPALAALLEHVAHSHGLTAPT